MPALLPLAYLAAVAVVAITRAVTGHPTVAAVALTPDRLGAGRAWLLATSAVIVNGPFLPQFVALVPTVVVSLRRLGGRFVIAVMVVAHVGATLLAYALLLVATGDPDGTHNPSYDYGTSAVWLGLLGALAAALFPAARAGSGRARALVALSVACVAGGVSLFSLMPALEHGFAFALGAGMTAVRESRRRADRSARSAASTASAPVAPA